MSPCLSKKKRALDEARKQYGKSYWLKQSIITKLKNGGFNVKFGSWTGAELKKIMDSRDVVDVDGPRSGHVCFHKGRRLIDRARVLGALAVDRCLS